MIGLIWAAFIAYTIHFSSGALCCIYLRTYLDIVDPEHKIPR